MLLKLIIVQKQGEKKRVIKMNLLCSRGGMEEDSTKKKVPIGAWPEADKPVRDEKTGLFGLYLQEARSKQNERGIN